MLHVAAMPDGDQQFVLSLFAQVQGTDVIGTGLCIAAVSEKLSLPTGHVCVLHDEEKTADFIEALSGAKGAELIGFTVENSTIGTLRFEVVASSDLAEGNVIFARLKGQNIFYQILDAETAEESFDRNPRGTHIVRAAQLGCYSPENGFTKYPWLPDMNTPLFAAGSIAFPAPKIEAREFEIGKVPSTEVSAVANIDELVEYHTAILGVTGTGKTELALDIVREAVKRAVKVFCVDFTGDYRQRLADLAPEFPSPTPQQGSDLEAKLFAAETGEYGAKKEKAVLKEAIDALRAQTGEQVDTFLRDDGKHLAIFELAEIANTKATLRLTELYLSAIMNWAKQNRRARQIMLVLEEAHTIVPETFGAGFDYDTQWVVSRIGQIALQGRKYGVGLLVITQRTALVSKTILSQCNTFLTHSLIDQTSLNFLESVYSSQHTRLIPNLGPFEFLAFGKALRAERPVLLKRPFDPAKKAASEALRRPLEQAPPEPTAVALGLGATE
jgi:DNA helicase HerA-like ATPase